jgi:hypothetical protein
MNLKKLKIGQTVVTAKPVGANELLALEHRIRKLGNEIINLSTLASKLSLDEVAKGLEALLSAYNSHVDYKHLAELLQKSLTKMVAASGIKKGAEIDGAKILNVKVSTTQEGGTTIPYLSVNFIYEGKQVHMEHSANGKLFGLISDDKEIPKYGQAEEINTIIKGWPDFGALIHELKNARAFRG